MARESFLLNARIFHKRLLPRVNQFSYDVFYCCHELSELKNSSSKFCKIYSINRPNLFSFYQKDYGAKDGSNLEKWAREILASESLNDKVSQIFLLSHPRIFGYVFNPVSFWFCLDEKKLLLAVIAQVNNTFGETHTYLVFNQTHQPILENQWLDAKKEFHVSPFFKVEGSYKFRFIFNETKIAVWIDYFTGQKQLITSLIGLKKTEISSFNLLLHFSRVPFMALKVIFLIHWQALKILAKKIRYIPKPKQMPHKITKSH